MAIESVAAAADGYEVVTLAKRCPQVSRDYVA